MPFAEIAPPAGPVPQLTPFESVAARPCLEESAAVGPEPSLNVQYPTRPGNVPGPPEELLAITVNPVEPAREPNAAWIVVVPVLAAVATPAASMVATVVSEDVHVAAPVKSCVLPSL